MMPAMNRRSVLLSGASVAALGLAALAGASAPVVAQAPASAPVISLDGFLALSSRLTGIAVGDLDPAMAVASLGGFVAAGHGDALVQLAGQSGEITGPLADEVVAAWYSGVYAAPDGPAVASFTSALVWRALDFTKPPGSCGGETGYWANPPQS